MGQTSKEKDRETRRAAARRETYLTGANKRDQHTATNKIY